MNIVYRNNIEVFEDEIVVYTVRNKLEFNDLINNQLIKANPNIVEEANKEWREFIHAYKWMSDQCSQRLVNYNSEYPLWCWKDKPSPRNIKVEYKKESSFYIVKFKIKKENVLFSSFSAWHFVLNEWFFNENEDDCLYETYDDISYFHKKGDIFLQEELEKSWHKIFSTWNDDLQQGCFESLNIDQVIEVREYKGNSNKEWVK